MDTRISDKLDPYIVLGIGRCGTSFVSDILHNDYNISMGAHFFPPNEYNPDGYYECTVFSNLLKFFIDGDITYATWIKGLYDYIRKRPARWGIKELNGTVLWFGTLYFQFSNPRVIFCERNKDLVYKSFSNKHKHTEGYSDRDIARIFGQRELYLEQIKSKLEGYLLIDFKDQRLSREQIKDYLENKWPDIND